MLFLINIYTADSQYRYSIFSFSLSHHRFVQSTHSSSSLYSSDFYSNVTYLQDVLQQTHHCFAPPVGFPALFKYFHIVSCRIVFSNALNCIPVAFTAFYSAMRYVQFAVLLHYSISRPSVPPYVCLSVCDDDVPWACVLG